MTIFLDLYRMSLPACLLLSNVYYSSSTLALALLAAPRRSMSLSMSSDVIVNRPAVRSIVIDGRSNEQVRSA